MRSSTEELAGVLVVTRFEILLKADLEYGATSTVHKRIFPRSRNPNQRLIDETETFASL